MLRRDWLDHCGFVVEATVLSCDRLSTEAVNVAASLGLQSEPSSLLLVLNLGTPIHHSGKRQDVCCCSTTKVDRESPSRSIRTDLTPAWTPLRSIPCFDLRMSARSPPLQKTLTVAWLSKRAWLLANRGRNESRLHGPVVIVCFFLYLCELIHLLAHCHPDKGSCIVALLHPYVDTTCLGSLGTIGTIHPDSVFRS